MSGGMLSEYCAKLGLSDKVSARADEIFSSCLWRNSWNTAGIIAASIYVAAILGRESRTQKQVAEACRVTQATVSHHFRKIQREESDEK